MSYGYLGLQMTTRKKYQWNHAYTWPYYWNKSSPWGDGQEVVVQLAYIAAYPYSKD